MQALLQTKIAEHIRDSITAQRISHSLYATLSNNTFFAVQTKDAVPAYSNQEVNSISYSSNDTVADIVNKVGEEPNIQQCHCSEYAIALIMELFTNYSIDVVMKCCGVVIFYNTIPILRLINRESVTDLLVVTIDLHQVERVINVECKNVAAVVDSSVSGTISSQPNAGFNVIAYSLAIVTVGMFALVAITVLRHQ